MKEKIYNFVIKFVDYDSGTPIEAIFDYYKVNKDLIEHEKKSILSFFEENFNIKYGSMSVSEFLVDHNGNTWIDLSDIKDLVLIDYVICLAIAVGIIQDSMKDRISSFGRIGPGGYILALSVEEALKEFDCEDREAAYLDAFKYIIFPNYRFSTTRKGIRELLLGNENKLKEMSKEEITACIFDWLRTSSIIINDNDVITLNDLLSSKYEKLINCIVLSFDIDDPSSFIIALRTNKLGEYIEDVDKIVSKYTDDQLEDLDVRKNYFFHKLNEENEKILERKKPTEKK